MREREGERALIVDIKNKNAIVKQNERKYLNLTIWRGNGEKNAFTYKEGGSEEGERLGGGGQWKKITCSGM